MGKQSVVLEHRVDITIKWGKLGDVRALQKNLTAGGCLKAGDDSKDGGFTGAGGAEHGKEFTLGDFEIEVGHSCDVAKGLVESQKADRRVGLNGGRGFRALR